MISKTLDENTISFIAEESDDLLTIRRLIKKGDRDCWRNNTCNKARKRIFKTR